MDALKQKEGKGVSQENKSEATMNGEARYGKQLPYTPVNT